MSVLNKKIVRELTQLRWQVISMAIVLAVGVALIVASLSAYQALKRAQSEFYQMSRFAHIFASFKQAPESIAANVEKIKGVLQAETRIVQDVMLETDAPEGIPSARIVTIPDSGPQTLNRLFLRKGRLPQSMFEVAASEAFAKANSLEPGSELTAIINGKRNKLLITGIALSPEYVFAFRASSPLPDDRFFGILWAKRELLSGAYNMKGACNDLLVLVDQSVRPESVSRKIDEILEPFGNPGSYTRKRQPSHVFVTEEMAQLKTTAVYMPGIFLGVAAFILHIVVGRMMERQREIIASFKALGYYNSEILLHYSFLILSIALLGALIGIPAGIWLGKYWTGLYQEFYHFPTLRFSLSLNILIVSLLAALVSAGAGGYRALFSVLKLDPAVAMRPPAPRAYTYGFLDRFILFRRSRAQTRIAVRPLLARPLRTFLAVTGMSFGIVVMIIGFFWIDAVDNMMAIQSNILDRSRATLSFYAAARTNITESISSAPGMIRVEPRRAVGIRIRNQNLEKTMAIIGIESNQELRRIVDDKYRIVRPRADGVYLNRKVAEKLHLEPGMLVQIELLEKDRRKRSIPLLGTVDEVLGSGAYMNRRGLDMLLDETGLVSDVAVTFDSAQKSEFLAWVKKNPLIAGVTLRERVLGVFRETMERQILGFVMVLIVLAFAIAMGVIYNSALVTLGEHQREFGTLRVLGFHHSEVFEVFVLELFTELLLAVPLGCVLGLWTASGMMSMVPDDTMQIPFYVSGRSYGLSIGVILLAAIVTLALIWKKIRKMDFISVLKLRD